MKLSKFELGWLCGLLEGDGTFTHDGKTPRVAVRMTDLDTVTRAATLLRTRVNGPYANEGNRQVYSCFISGKRARSFMQSIRPYMSMRRQSQIDSLLGNQLNLFPFPRNVKRET